MSQTVYCIHYPIKPLAWFIREAQRDDALGYHAGEIPFSLTVSAESNDEIAEQAAAFGDELRRTYGMQPSTAGFVWKCRGGEVSEPFETEAACWQAAADHFAKTAAPPRFCPYCGGPKLRDCVEWSARSLDTSDRDNTATLTEYQCDGDCEGRSFWA